MKYICVFLMIVFIQSCDFQNQNGLVGNPNTDTTLNKPVLFSTNLYPINTNFLDNEKATFFMGLGNGNSYNVIDAFGNINDIHLSSMYDFNTSEFTLVDGNYIKNNFVNGTLLYSGYSNATTVNFIEMNSSFNDTMFYAFESFLDYKSLIKKYSTGTTSSGSISFFPATPDEPIYLSVQSQKSCTENSKVLYGFIKIDNYNINKDFNYIHMIGRTMVEK